MEFGSAPATYALMLTTVMVSVYGLSINRKFTRRFLFNVGALVRDKQHYRVFTSSFLHGNYPHLALNMITLWFFGPNIERILGVDGFLVVYFGAVLASGIVSYYVNRANPNYSSLGASDGVSGVVLSFCLFYPLEPLYIMFIPIGVPAILFAAVFIIVSANLMGRQGNRIAHEGHLGGAVAGALLTLAMKPEIVGRFFG